MKKVRALLLMTVAVTLASLSVGESVSAASASSCVENVADYQYATPSPQFEQLTATTMSCRREAPWIILIHGGSWINGTRANADRETYNFYKYGWQVFNMDYRRGPDVAWPLQRNDLVAAYNWVVAHARQFHLDIRKGTAYGFSAGGQMAAWLGNLRPLSSVVTQSGVLQPQRVADDAAALRPSTEPPTDAMIALDKREADMMGCNWPAGNAECRAQWDGFDPENAITSRSAPAYLVQGTQDAVIPVPTIDAYGYWLGRHGVKHVEVFVNGYGHDNGMLFDGSPASDKRFYELRKWMVGQW